MAKSVSIIPEKQDSLWLDPNSCYGSHAVLPFADLRENEKAKHKRGTQSAFAKAYGRSLDAVRDWESGIRVRDRSAGTLITVIEETECRS